MGKMIANRLILDANCSGMGGWGADIADMHKDPTVSVLWKGTKDKSALDLASVKHEIFVKEHPFFL